MYFKLQNDQKNSFNDQEEKYGENEIHQKIRVLNHELKEFNQTTQLGFDKILTQIFQLIGLYKDGEEQQLQWHSITDEENQMINQFSSLKNQLACCVRDLEIFLKTLKNNYFNYQVLKDAQYRQSQWCYSQAFNQENSLMIANYDSTVNVFEFQKEKLTLSQSLKGHTKDVYCLQFMKKTQQFVSADHNVIIWDQEQNKQWRMIQILEGHQMIIYCIALNQKEDQIISGSQDKTIKFWRKNANNNWKLSQSYDCLSRVFAISLNDSEEKLIAAVEDHSIIVFRQQQNEWKNILNIKVEQFGYRLCFFSETQFVFQPFDKQYLEVYQYQEQTQTFAIMDRVVYKNKALDGNCLFHIRFIKQQGILFVKNDHFAHIIKVQENEKLKIVQSFSFYQPVVYGTISNDGRFIITWDRDTRLIQVRKNFI